MPRRPPLTVAGLLLVAACGASAPGPVPVPTLLASSRCGALVTALPSSLGKGLAKRSVTPDDGTTAAWGSPAVTLRCGVAAASPVDDTYAFDGLRWALHDDGASNRWTSVTKGFAVAVRIPDAYDSQATLLGTLSPLVLAA